MFTKLANWYHAHGTKILGTIVALIGGVTLIPELSNFPALALALKIVNVALGAMTVARGYVNSANIAATKVG